MRIFLNPYFHISMLYQFVLLHNLASLEKINNADTNKLTYKRGKIYPQKAYRLQLGNRLSHSYSGSQNSFLYRNSTFWK